MRTWVRYYLCIKGLVINCGEGGLQNGKITGPKLFAPPPLLKSGNFSCPPYNMAKTWMGTILVRFRK